MSEDQQGAYGRRAMALIAEGYISEVVREQEPDEVIVDLTVEEASNEVASNIIV